MHASASSIQSWISEVSIAFSSPDLKARRATSAPPSRAQNKDAASSPSHTPKHHRKRKRSISSLPFQKRLLPVHHHNPKIPSPSPLPSSAPAPSSAFAVAQILPSPIESASQTEASSRTTPSSQRSKRLAANETSQRLDFHRIYIDEDSLEGYPSLLATLQEIVDPERLSAKKPHPSEIQKEDQQAWDYHRKHSVDSENTFLDEISPTFIKSEFEPSQDSRHGIRVEAGKTLGYTTPGSKTAYFNSVKNNDFRKHGLRCTSNKDFVRHHIPSRTPGILDEALTNPRPDRAYGFEPQFFDYTVPQSLVIPTNLQLLFGVAP